MRPKALSSAIVLGLLFSAGRLPADLAALWEFDGDLLDSRGDHHGTFVGGDAPAFVDGRDGTPGGAILLDGVNDVVQVQAAPDLVLPGDFTFAFWIRFATIGQASKYLLAKNGGGSQFAVLYGFTAGKVDFFAPGAVGTDPRTGGASEMPLADTDWHHIAYSRTGSTWSGYIDGIPVFSIERSFNLNGFTAPWFIGAANEAAANAVGAAMDEVRIYDSGLTAQNIQDLFDGVDDCPEEGDTHCLGMEVDGPPGNEPGTYTVAASAVDDSGDPVIYTFRATSAGGTVLIAGPQADPTASFDLGAGTWTISVRVDDDGFCLDEAADAACTVGPFDVAVIPRLVARWEFDGDLLDSAGGNDGTFHGGESPVFATGYDGTREGSIVFDGVNDYVEIPYARELALSSAFSFVFWFKTGSLGQTEKYLLSRNGSGRQYAVIYEYVDDRVEFYAPARTGPDPRPSSAIPLEDTAWHLIAYTYDGAALAGYLDGVPVFSTGIEFALDDTFVAPWFIGTSNAIANFAQGAFDDIRIYNYGLSAGEVADLYSEPVDCPEEGDTRCTGLTVTGPEGGGQGVYVVSAAGEDDSGDPLLFTFVADDGAGQRIVVGPQAEASAELILTAGTWQVSVTVDDDPVCPDESAESTCAETVDVSYVPALLARYAFDGDLTDSTGLHDGAFFGGEAPTFVDGYDGTPGGALELDGVDDHVRIAPSQLLAFTTDFTFAFWFKSGSLGQSEKYLLSRNDSFPGGSGKQYAVIYGYTADRVDFYAPARASGDDPRAGGASEMPLADTEWHHIAYAYDGATWAGYIDGAPVFSTEIEFVLDTFRSAWWIGAANPLGNFVDGAFDEVRLYNYALSAEEIAALAVVPSEGIGPLLRGDSNGDAKVDISDPVYTLNWLFLGGPTLPCAAAGDANGDGGVDISDPQYSLNYLFLGGPPPVAPFPDCGFSEAAGDLELGCETPLGACP